MRAKNYLGTLNRFELILWLSSVAVVTTSFLITRQGILSLTASLIGVTALIYLAKGMILGQVLSIVFSLLYGIISYKFGYYGEMITYLFMTMPMAIFATIEWLRNPYKNSNTVKVSGVSKKSVIVMLILAAITTCTFYFLLRYLNTENLLFSTISITTSFIAAYLCALRSPFFALGYAANDIVLIALWVLATFKDISFAPMIACFSMFLFNDLYGFLNWRRMKRLQK